MPSLVVDGTPTRSVKTDSSSVMEEKSPSLTSNASLGACRFSPTMEGQPSRSMFDPVGLIGKPPKNHVETQPQEIPRTHREEPAGGASEGGKTPRLRFERGSTGGSLRRRQLLPSCSKRKGLLTDWHIEKLLDGKYKGILSWQVQTAWPYRHRRYEQCLLGRTYEAARQTCHQGPTQRNASPTPPIWLASNSKPRRSRHSTTRTSSLRTTSTTRVMSITS